MQGESGAEGADDFVGIHFYDWFMSGWFVLFWPSALAGFAGVPEGLGAGLVIRQHLADGGEEQVAGDFGELAGVGLVIHWVAWCIYDNGEASTHSNTLF